MAATIARDHGGPMTAGGLKGEAGWVPCARLDRVPIPTGGWNWLFWATNEATVEVLSFEKAAYETLRSRKLARLEAALLVAPEPMPVRKLMQVATLADAAEVRLLIEQLNRAYDTSASAFRVERMASGYRLLTRPVFSHWLGKLHHRQQENKLSPIMLEALAVIAYRQPLTRADLEAIRGAQSVDLLKHLMDRGLVRIAGEEDSLGRPFLYETTRKFLEMFGLRGLEELPNAANLRRPKSVVKGAGPAVLDDAA